MKKVENVNDYIASFSEEIQKGLNQIRKTILENAPDALECISYHMPAYKQNGILVYFSACKTHFGFYPTPSAIQYFKEELSDYVFSKGAIQFPFKKEIPLDLIQKMVRFKINENNKKRI